MTGLWEQTSRHTELIYYTGSLEAALSAGAGVDGRQPGYFLRQPSRARGHLIGTHTESLEKSQMKNSNAAVPFNVYLTAI